MMRKKVYKTRAKVWLYPGMAGWHFVNVDEKQSAELKEKYKRVRRGFGSVPVEVTIGKTSWKTSIFPDKRSGTYLLPLKAEVRKRENIRVNETITFSFVVR